MIGRVPKILIIDDEPRMVEVLTLTLEGVGFRVITAYNGRDGLRTAYAEHPDLILLDIMMPGMDGFQVLDYLRLMTDVPVIMLTAAGHDSNRIRGMDKGAADFLSKGTHTDVLLAHIHARLRAYEKHQPTPGPRELDAHVKIDLARRRLQVGGQSVNLTPLQWRLLGCLMEHEGQVTKYKELMTAGWDYSDIADERALKVQISQLREKLRDRAHGSRYIHTIREEGYLFEVR